MLHSSRLAALLSILALATPARADLTLPSVFADHMVFQRNTAAPIWGHAEPSARVSVHAGWRDAPSITEADEDGHWRVDLSTPDAGGPYEVTIVSGEDRVEILDVLVGEVWLCSGQSNMQWSVAPFQGMSGAQNPEAEVAAANHPDLRLFHATRATATAPQEDVEGAWTVCTPETVPGWSATAYYFGRELQRQLGVPIGLLHSSWGGTLCEAWTSAEGLADFSEFEEVIQRVAEARQDPDGLEAKAREELAEWWRSVGDEDPEAHLAGFDDSSWKTMELPGRWVDAQPDVGLGGFDGVVWFRREVEIPEAWAGRALVLELGPIDDLDTTWFNGRRVGGIEEMGHWQTPRRYPIPAGRSRAGRAVIAVRVIDTGGLGGACGQAEQMRLRLADEPDSDPLPLDGNWRFRRGASMGELGSMPGERWFNSDTPTALFNGMIAPLVPYALRGTIWYQGESNRPRAAQYRRLFPAMIADWRGRFERGDFPFYFVQIAPYRYGGDNGQAAELREAQMLTLAVPNTGMAVTMDIGNPGDIHPKNKQEVGRRLALWALARDYGRSDLECSGPLYRSMTVVEDQVRITFDHTQGGLVAEGGELTHFTVAGADREFHPAQARIEGEVLVVSCAAVAEPVAVRFAWGAADEPNLKNGAGLPASSFRTDDWPPVSKRR